MFDIKTADDIPGWTWKSQLEHIATLAKSYDSKIKVLEIGCAWGRSTWQWLDNLPIDSELWVIDAFVLKTPHKHAKAFRHLLPGNETVQKIIARYGEVGHYQTFLDVINLHPKKRMLKKILSGRSKTYYDQTNFQWDIVYIDGAHDYETVKSDIFNYGPITKILCGDDYGEGSPGVIQAVDEYVKSTNKQFYQDPAGPYWMIK